MVSSENHYEYNHKYNHNYKLFFAFSAGIIIALDQFSKWLITYFNPQWNFFLLDIHLITNTGAGFGLFKEKAFLLGIISLLVALGIILYYQKIPQIYLAQLFTALFLGGTIGNLIDRFARGYVIDFIDLRFWPAFNLADAAISLAVLGIIWLVWREKHNPKESKK